jgi:hypothetical protein
VRPFSGPQELEMDNEYSFMDLSQYDHTQQLSNVAPSVTQHAQPLMVPTLHQPLHSVSSMPPSKVGKRQTNRVKYTDEEVQRICSMKEAGWPWRYGYHLSMLTGSCSKIAAHFPGRSQKSLQVSYCVNFKKRTEKFQDEDVQLSRDSKTDIQKELLETVLSDEINEMWKRVGQRMGKSVKGCQQKAKDWGIAVR